MKTERPEGPIARRWSRFPRWSRWAAGAILFYTLFGFLILPVIVKKVATRRIAQLLDREVAIEKVRINPYVLSTTVRGLRIRDKDGETLVSWSDFYANLQLVSLLGRTWVFKEIRLAQPYARVQVNKDHSLN